LNDEASKIARLRGSRSAVETDAATVGDLMAIYQERAKANTNLKPSSIVSRLAALKRLQKT